MFDETLLEAEEKMEKAVAVAKDDFATIRTGRVHPSVFNKIMVEKIRPIAVRHSTP